MANRASIRANLSIRYVADSDFDTGISYTAARTFEVTNCNVILGTANAGNVQLRKGASEIGRVTATPTQNENLQLAKIDTAFANLVAGDTLNLVASAANLDPTRAYVTIIPGATSAT